MLIDLELVNVLSKVAIFDLTHPLEAIKARVMAENGVKLASVNIKN